MEPPIQSPIITYNINKYMCIEWDEDWSAIPQRLHQMMKAEVAYVYS